MYPIRDKKDDSWVSQYLVGMLYCMVMDLYPINELVRRVAAASGLTALELLQKLGYKNFNKGKRLLDALVAHNSLSKDHKHFRDKFFEIFAVAEVEIEQARNETQKVLRSAAAGPAVNSMLLMAVFEEKPKGLHGFMGLYAAAKFHEFKPVEPEYLLPLIRELVLLRVRNHTDKVPPIGYRLLVSPVETWLFDRTGNLVEKLQVMPPRVAF